MTSCGQRKAAHVVARLEQWGADEARGLCPISPLYAADDALAGADRSRLFQHLAQFAATLPPEHPDKRLAGVASLRLQLLLDAVRALAAHCRSAGDAKTLADLEFALMVTGLDWLEFATAAELWEPLPLSPPLPLSLPLHVETS